MRHGASDPTDTEIRPAGPASPLCARFEAAWKSAPAAAARPRIQDYLHNLPDTERSEAFGPLLMTELRCRRAAGEDPSAADYLSCFPEEARRIRAIFDEIGPIPDSESEMTGAVDGDPRRILDSPTAVESADSDHAGPSSNGTSVLSHPEGPDSGVTMDYPRPGGTLGGSATEATSSVGRPRSSDTHQTDADAAAEEPLPEVPGYEILGRLGRGGMGIVYKARDVKLRRDVALKMIHRRRRPVRQTDVDRFLGEARAVAQCQHPHLVQIFEIGEHQGQPYLSLELVEGGSLSRTLEGTPRVASEAAALVETLARAVEYAHQKGIVDRDLKPANILLAADGTPKITDFGLAKQQGSEIDLKEDGAVMGTPAYMAPEQAWGKNSEVGTAADVYALGVILYEMLTGRPPLKASNRSQTIELVRTQEPVPPRQLVPTVPRDLELICLKCLRKDPAARLPSAHELAEELRRFQDGRPIKTRPAPPWEKAWKWSKRNRAAASLIIVSVALAAIFVAYLFRELREERRIGVLRTKVATFQAQADEVKQNDIAEANKHLHAAFQIIRGEPSLADMEPGLVALQTEVDRLEAEERSKKEAEDAFVAFMKALESARFHGMVFTGGDLPATRDENVAKAQEACREGLARFQIKRDGGADLGFPKYMGDDRRRTCTLGCYEMLLIWAETEAQAGKPAESLVLLDRAARLKVPSTKAYHLRRASYLALAGQPGPARLEQDKADHMEPQGALDYFLTGDSHQRQQKLDLAAADFASALKHEPGHFWARYFLGMCNLRQLKTTQARDNFTACMIVRDKFVWLYIYRGFANGLAYKFREAEDDYRQALTLLKKEPDPQAHYSILVHQGILQTRQADVFAGWRTLSRQLPIGPGLRLGLSGTFDSSRNRKLQAATGYLDEAHDLRPQSYLAYRYSALVLEKQRRLGDALARVDQAIDVAAKESAEVRAQLYGQRARIQRQRNDLEAALKDLDQAKEIAASAEDLLERGQVLQALGDPVGALESYEAALAIKPALTGAYLGKADALLVLKRGKEAAAVLDQYLAHGGRPTAEIHRIRARRSAAAGDAKENLSALAEYTKAIELQPDSATYAERAWVFLANKANDLALRDFEDAIRLDSKNAEAYAGRALVRVKEGKGQAAKEDVITALGLGVHNFRLYWNAAHVYAQLAAELERPGTPPAQRAFLPKYQATAVELLREGFKCAKGDHAARWREFIAQDGLLDPIRGTPEFKQLERDYAK